MKTLVPEQTPGRFACRPLFRLRYSGPIRGRDVIIGPIGELLHSV